MVPLGSVCKIQIGRTPRRANGAYWTEGTEPWVSIADLTRSRVAGETNEKITKFAVIDCGCKRIPENTVLFSFKLSIGKVAISDRSLFTNEAIAALPVVNSDRLDVKFLARALESIDFSMAGQRAVMGMTLNKESLAKIEIPLPPLAEQRRIAGILDAADALRRRRREALALLDTLPGAVFAEMFGDPVGKSQKRNFVPLGSITSKIGSGATPRGGAKVYRDEGTKFIRSMNVRDGTFSEDGMVCIDEKAAQQLSNVEVTKDDVFLNITGASVARCCRSDATLTGARVNQHVAIIRPQNPVFTDFIMGALCHPHMRANLLRIAESGATRQAITKSEIEGLEVPAPTENEAEEYSRRLRVLNGARDLVSDQQSELETLFASLQSRAFAGEL
ncbi:restriction endonuclease subunit S [Paracoccus sanguinis]|uniref:restriction endonuclease subunit S n=1 Tax=Paracoccus sanguinis TaxID=1545044 RepID=UPI0020A1297D|nr:restriction endonuclease subunit S [Paracoccus sanguinis]